MLKASFLKLEINEFGCYEAKIEESEKHTEWLPGVRLSGCQYCLYHWPNDNVFWIIQSNRQKKIDIWVQTIHCGEDSYNYKPYNYTKDVGMCEVPVVQYSKSDNALVS